MHYFDQVYEGGCGEGGFVEVDLPLSYGNNINGIVSVCIG